MARVKKDIMWPGEVDLPDGRGGRRRLRFTPQFVAHLGRRMRDMMAAGLSIPLAWEHQDEAKPQTPEEQARRKAEAAKLTLGRATAAELGPDGVVHGEFEVPLDEDARRLPSVGFVSPEIRWNFRDGTGRLWPGPSITHVAVTAKPVCHWQRPFTQSAVAASPAVALSLAVSRLRRGPAAASPDLVRLSLTDLVPIRLGESAMPETSEKNKDQERQGDAGLRPLIEALREAGLTIPDEVTDLDGLIIAVKASGSPAAADTAEPEAVPEQETSPPAAALMSREQLQELTLKLSRAEERAKLAESRAVQAEQASLKGRIHALAASGRIGPRLRESLLAELKTVRLSLDERGELAPVPILSKVEAYEALEPNTSWAAEAAQLSLGEREVEVEPPDSVADARATVQEIVRLSGCDEKTAEGIVARLTR
jgi:hypothetical protein